MPQPATQIQTVLLLRAIAILAFPVGVVLAAIMERSVLMVALLAAGMLLVSWVERFRLHRLAGNEAYPAITGLLPGFAWRAGLLAGLFIVSLGVLALFRETILARGLGLEDLVLFCAVTGVALIANGISARMATHEVSGVMARMNAGFGQPGPEGPGGAGSGDGDIIEGEVIDRD